MRVGETVDKIANQYPDSARRGDGWFVGTITERNWVDVLDWTRCLRDPLRGSTAPEQRVRGLISYALRDFSMHPVDPDATEPQVLAVCPHHEGGALVMTDDFDIRFLTHEDLGVRRGTSIKVGPGAGHPFLEHVRFETRLDEVAVGRRRALLECSKNLRELGAVFVAEREGKPGPPPYSGPALMLHYRARGDIAAGHERVFRCAMDPELPVTLSEEQFARRYERLDLAAPDRELISYAVRDFASHPLASDFYARQSVMACTHHAGGALVLYDDGSVEFRDRMYFGLLLDEPIQVGSESSVHVLRPLVMARRRLKEARDPPETNAEK